MRGIPAGAAQGEAGTGASGARWKRLILVAELKRRSSSGEMGTTVGPILIMRYKYYQILYSIKQHEFCPSRMVFLSGPCTAVRNPTADIRIASNDSDLVSTGSDRAVRESVASALHSVRPIVRREQKGRLAAAPVGGRLSGKRRVDSMPASDLSTIKSLCSTTLTIFSGSPAS